MQITLKDILDNIASKKDTQVIGYPGEPFRTLIAFVMDDLYPTHMWTVLNNRLEGISAEHEEDNDIVYVTLTPDVLLIHQLFEAMDRPVVYKGDLK